MFSLFNMDAYITLDQRQQSQGQLWITINPWIQSKILVCSCAKFDGVQENINHATFICVKYDEKMYNVII